MRLQYLNNDKGEKTAELIPWKEWNALEKEHQLMKRKLEKAEFMLRLKKVLKDVQRYKKGKLKTEPIESLINEL